MPVDGQINNYLLVFMVKIMVSSFKKNKSLIMCTTPLQMIIAERIIDLHPDKSFDLIVVTLNSNEKYRYYFNKLKKSCNNNLYYVSKEGLVEFINFIRELTINNVNKNYTDLFIASIDLRHFQYVASKNKNAKIYTFDDGLANIIESDIYYSNTVPKWYKKIIWYFIGVKYYIKDIREKSLLHYTIYKNIPNIISNTKFIELFQASQSINYNNYKKIKIYLGQPLSEMSKIIDDNYIIEVVEKLNIDYYYPHPREFCIPNVKAKIIHSNLVFEDYILDFLRKNNDLTVEVYSFISGTLLNIVSIDRVKVNFIYEKNLYKEFEEFYDFSKLSFGIQTINAN